MSPVPSLDAYLSPAGCPRERPPLAALSGPTRELHESIDAAIRRQGLPYLHPSDPTLQLDMLGSRRMIEWQERKAEWVFGGERCWFSLQPFYARYGVELTRRLAARVQGLENAAGAILADCGMQAVALTFDTLARGRGHAVLFRGVYNKTRRYLEWLGGRLGLQVTIVDEGDLAALEHAVRPETCLVFGETYTNPLTRALDPAALSDLALKLRRERAPDLRLVLDNTIASPWGLRRPLLDFPGIDAIAASGTKALAGQDRDLCGYIASNRIDFLNEVMDLLAMRGGVLDWRRAAAILEGLELAEQRFERRCRSAGEVARFLVAHPRVETVHHPSLPGHPDRRVIDEHYCRSGSLLSFSLKGLDEDATRHFADVLATCIVFRYAGSFDGLSSKVNHHRTVSEYFTAEEELKRAGITRLVRLGIGIEASADLQACLNWALWHHRDLSSDVVLAWQGDREKELGLRERS